MGRAGSFCIKLKELIVLTWGTCGGTYRRHSRSSLGFSANFPLARSSTRLNSCTSSQSSPNCNSAIRIALAWSINKAYTWSCNMLKYPTLNAITSKCIVSNRCSRNCSIPNLKIVSGQGGSLHCIFCVISGVARPRGAEFGSHGAGVGNGQNSAPWRRRIRYASVEKGAEMAP
jgi:hypothetical protein